MSITIIFTNWRRKNNLKKIVEATKKQTTLPKIVIVDNASNDKEHSFESDEDSVLVIKKDNSLMCWARWLESFNHDSEYICVMDDDLIFTNKDVINLCYQFMEKNKEIDCIGLEGVILNKESYVTSFHVFPSNEDLKVSVVKGRFMFIRKSSLNKLDLKPDLTCDDIKVSSFLKNKIIPSFLKNSFIDLPSGNESLSAKQYQHIKREYASKKYF